jgi:hypothetical protein
VQRNKHDGPCTAWQLALLCLPVQNIRRCAQWHARPVARKVPGMCPVCRTQHTGPGSNSFKPLYHVGIDLAVANCACGKRGA